MSEPTLRAAAIQRALKLSEPDALKVLIFMAGMQAAGEMQIAEKVERGEAYERAAKSA